MIPANHLGVRYTGPFHAALRAVVRDSGLTLDRLRCRLARHGITVGISSLSDWQNGRSRPSSPRAVRGIEQILGLPPGALLRLLEVDGPRLPDLGPMAELLHALPASGDHDVELISAQHTVVVDAHMRTELLWTRTAIRALRDGVDRYVVRYYGNDGCVPALVLPRALGNCRLGRFVPHPSAPVLAYELLFGQVLRAGETWVFESALVDRTGGACTEFAFGFRHPATQYLLEVRFHPGALPTRCYSFAQFDLADERHPTADLALTRHNSVHLVASSVNSGVLGIKWDWGCQ